VQGPPIYLDNHATTRADPRAVEAMLPFFSAHYGNASSIAHRFGWEADEAVEGARGEVAALIGAEPREVVFTSGATEANNLAIKGVAAGLISRGNHLVTATVEHKSVLDPMRRLAREGWDVSFVSPDPSGRVSAGAVAGALTDRTVLVSIMAANHEVGAINPIAEIGRLCRDRGVVFHVDATQAVGKVPIDVAASCVDLLSLSAHKFYGPKGIGALFVGRAGRSFRLAPLFDGGGQERGLRSGTVAVPLVVGLGRAASLAREAMPDESARILGLRESLHAALRERVGAIRLNGPRDGRLPGNLNLSFEGIGGEALTMALRDVAVSSGSACDSANPEPSYVLRALGVPEDLARASLRFGLGRFTTAEEIDLAAGSIASVVARIRIRGAAGPSDRRAGI
jgi:cysteine desulfurase